MIVMRAVEVVLTIPDNEARTALATLQRLGVAAGGLERGALYCCAVDATEADDLVASLRGLETIYNPNKHALRVRDGDTPLPGEIWVEELAPPAQTVVTGVVRIGGRTLPGLRHLGTATAWRVFDDDGAPAGPDLTRAAAETLLCNPAFQKATMSDDRT